MFKKGFSVECLFSALLMWFFTIYIFTMWMVVLYCDQQPFDDFLSWNSLIVYEYFFTGFMHCLSSFHNLILWCPETKLKKMLHIFFAEKIEIFWSFDGVSCINCLESFFPLRRWFYMFLSRRWWLLVVYLLCIVLLLFV